MKLVGSYDNETLIAVGAVQPLEANQPFEFLVNFSNEEFSLFVERNARWDEMVYDSFDVPGSFRTFEVHVAWIEFKDVENNGAWNFIRLITI